MLKEIPKSDIIVRPFKVYREWTLDENDISPVFGANSSSFLIDVDTADKSNGFAKGLVWASVYNQFYRNAATASILTEVGRRKSYASKDERILENNIAVFSIPQIKYGEGIKIGTVVLQDEQLGRTYTDDGYSNLIDSGSNIKGNIFYDRGLIVVAKDVVSGSVLSQFTLDFRSTKTIFENEIFIPVLDHEFNYSQNPSAVYEDGGEVNSYITQRPESIKINDYVTQSFYNAGTKYIRGGKYPYQSSLDPNKFGSFDDYEISGSLDQTGSYLAPYITTIGLYDNELNMVAVAKLPQPIKCMHDYPVNFIVRFDT
jgi:hypothetical protein